MEMNNVDSLLEEIRRTLPNEEGDDSYNRGDDSSEVVRKIPLDRNQNQSSNKESLHNTHPNDSSEFINDSSSPVANDSSLIDKAQAD